MEFDKKLFESVCREYVLDVVNKSKYLRVRLPLVEHAKIYEWTRNKASYNQVVSLIISDNKKVATKEAVAEIEGAYKTMFEQFLFKKYPFQGSMKPGVGSKVAWKLANVKLGTAAAIALVGLYLYKKLKDPCIRQCKLNKECIKTCRATAISKTISSLHSQLPNCQNTPNPAKCEANIKKEIEKWNDKLRVVMSK